MDKFRFALAALFLVTSCVVSTSLAAPLYAPTEAELTEIADEALRLFNEVRLSKNLPPMTMNDQLVASAKGHSEYLSRLDSWTHRGPDGSSVATRIARAGYLATGTSEIVGIGFDGSAGRFVNWMLGSPNHRPIVLSPVYTQIGIAVVYKPNTTYRWFWTGDFGRPNEAPGEAPGETVKAPPPEGGRPAPRGAGATRTPTTTPLPTLTPAPTSTPLPTPLPTATPTPTPTTLAPVVLSLTSQSAELEVWLENANGVSGGEVWLEFDPAVLTIVGIELNSGRSLALEDGALHFAFARDPAAGSERLGKLKLRAEAGTIVSFNPAKTTLWTGNGPVTLLSLRPAKIIP